METIPSAAPTPFSFPSDVYHIPYTVLYTIYSNIYIISPLTWVPLAELLRGGAHLPVHNAFVLLLLCVGFQSLPREAASNEVHQHVPVREAREMMRHGTAQHYMLPET